MLRAEVYARAWEAERLIRSWSCPFILNQTLRSLRTIVFPADSIPCSSLITGLSLEVYPEECRFRASELELELIQTQMAQKPMLRAEVGMRVRCANKASAE